MQILIDISCFFLYFFLFLLFGCSWLWLFGFARGTRAGSGDCRAPPLHPFRRRGGGSGPSRAIAIRSRGRTERGREGSHSGRERGRERGGSRGGGLHGHAQSSAAGRYSRRGLDPRAAGLQRALQLRLPPLQVLLLCRWHEHPIHAGKLSIYLCIYLSIHISVSIFLSIYLSVCLSISIYLLVLALSPSLSSLIRHRPFFFLPKTTEMFRPVFCVSFLFFFSSASYFLLLLFFASLTQIRSLFPPFGRMQPGVYAVRTTIVTFAKWTRSTSRTTGVPSNRLLSAPQKACTRWSMRTHSARTTAPLCSLPRLLAVATRG